MSRHWRRGPFLENNGHQFRPLWFSSSPPRSPVGTDVLAKYCFELGIELKRIEVVADDEGEIVEAVRRMSKNYDMVVTSGGIGPTHDDLVTPPPSPALPPAPPPYRD